MHTHKLSENKVFELRSIQFTYAVEKVNIVAYIGSIPSFIRSILFIYLHSFVPLSSVSHIHKLAGIIHIYIYVLDKHANIPGIRAICSHYHWYVPWEWACLMDPVKPMATVRN